MKIGLSPPGFDPVTLNRRSLSSFTPRTHSVLATFSYQYEHCFSYSWNAMKGYHYLMRIGHLLNVLVLNAVQLSKIVATLGARGFIRFIRQTLSGPWLDAEQVRRRLSQPTYLRFV